MAKQEMASIVRHFESLLPAEADRSRCFVLEVKGEPGREGIALLRAESHKHLARVEEAENVLTMGRVVAVMRTLF